MALVSVIAAVILVVTKITVGYLTNSLGIISEALHSSIDLIAAVMTLVAVRMADRPADRDHMYGHEKIEGMSSLAETLLLFITCGWIVYEAVKRLFYEAPEVEITYAAIFVMVLSIVVDFTRSRALMKAAKKYRSQALEADALHFSTDMLSSVVVLIGITFTMMGFQSFDALAALGVAVITAFIGYRIWKKSMRTLLDYGPSEMHDQVVESAMKVDGVHSVDRVRVRDSGSKVFVDATVCIDKSLPLEQAHKVAEQVTREIQGLAPHADVMIHAEPCSVHSSDLVDMIRGAAVDFPAIRTVHDIIVTESGEQIHVDLHLEMDGDLGLEEAHQVVTEFERHVVDLEPGITSICSHLEPVKSLAKADGSERAELDRVATSIRELASSEPGVLSLGDVTVRRRDGAIEVTICCRIDSSAKVQEAHEMATRLEAKVKDGHEDVSFVNVHVEPHQRP